MERWQMLVSLSLFFLGVVWGKLHFQSNKHHKGLGTADVGF